MQGIGLAPEVPVTAKPKGTVPQFEWDPTVPEYTSSLERGRTAEDAVRRAAGVPADAQVEILATGDLQGWKRVRIDGREVGRVRIHQRMRFRRD